MIELYPHNQRDYEAMVSMLDDRGAACVIKPPSDGKAILGMHLAESEPDSTVVWVNPQTLHFEQQRANAVRLSGEGPGPAHDFDNVVPMTYAALARIAETGEVPDVDPDILVIDELHHAGAPVWGRGVEALLAAFPHARLVGFSATPVRYQDGGRDMAAELFGDCIAVDRSIQEAWADEGNPLRPPTYVRALYSKADERGAIASLRDRASRLSPEAAGRRDAVTEQINRLARFVEDADGVDAVMERHIGEPDAKVLVFCKNREHLYELSSDEKVAEWFGGVNEDVHVYRCEATRRDNADQLAGFNGDDSGALKVLYSINMFNEAMHVRGARYAVMARPTASPGVWIQQIGRVMEPGPDGEPGVCIDLARNFVRATGYLAYRGGGTGSPRDSAPWEGEGRSVVSDELMEVAALVDAIKDNLAAAATPHEVVMAWVEAQRSKGRTPAHA